MKKSEKIKFLEFYGEGVAALLQINEKINSTYNNNELKELETSERIISERLDTLETVAYKIFGHDFYLDCREIADGIVYNYEKQKRQGELK